jgi:hypothetical protein
MSSLALQLKRLVESIHPDLRPFFRPSLLGTVSAVHDYAYRVDVEIGEQHPDAPDATLSLVDVPVSSIWAQDGYGVWALPEVGSEVTISFHDGDVTRPYVESPIFYNNSAPGGFRAGTFAIRGKHGQKIEMKADSGEIVIAGGSVKIIRTQGAQACTVGEESDEVVGDRRVTVSRVDALDVKERVCSVRGNDRVSVGGSQVQSITGNLDLSVGGKVSQNIAGSVARSVAGGSSEAVAFSKRILTGGAFELIAANTLGAPQAIVLQAGMGDISLSTATGMINIGAPPMAGTVNLGGTPAIGQPAVLGNILLSILNQLLTVLQGSLQLGNLGGPTAPNPAFVALVAPLQAQLSTMLSTKIMIAPA